MREKKHGLKRRTFYAIRSLLRRIYRKETESGNLSDKPESNKGGIKVAFIHNEKRIHTGMHTGAAQINRLMAEALAKRGVKVRNFYPTIQLLDAPVHLKGVSNVLFFYSLLEKKDAILKYDIIQGTTYTPLPFLSFNTPVICHFGSTTRGFVDNVPPTKALPWRERGVYRELLKLNIIPELDLKTSRPIEDVADIETLAASRATACIATSNRVKEELVMMDIPPKNIRVIHNAIEDYWFEPRQREDVSKSPHLVFLGRLGGDVFTLKLKGLDRMVNIYRSFPDVPKTTICMTNNQKLKEWLRVSFPDHHMYVNMRKDFIPGALAPLYGSILLLVSRYEGFSLSLVEGMSQGLVPVSFPVGVAPEIIENGKNGFIVSNEKEAVEKIRELLTNNEKRLLMAEEAKKTAEQFTSMRISKDLFRLYYEVKSERKSAGKENNKKELVFRL